MKKRILFVDDEPMVLDGLRRMLRPLSAEWDMEFVDGGARALACMAEQPFGVVVADMRMPGMNGAELLNEVMKRHPKTVRLILSGHADKELILQCVGSTHQYLAKPCEPDALKAVVQRAFRLDDVLQDERLKKLVGQLTRLPSIPSLYMEIIEKANHPDCSLEDIARVIGRDPGMTAKMLKLVNSAFFGLRRELSSPEEAVAYIGLDTIKSLVLSLHAFSQFERVNVADLTVEVLWNHSLTVAARARHLAQLEEGDRKTMDEAFTAGLLHDLGKLVLAANLPALYDQARRLSAERGCEPQAAELQVFGASHADVGGYLLGLWGLPVPVVEAIALHHHPERSAQPGFSPLIAVHVADALVWESSNGLPPAVRPSVNVAHLASAGLADRVDVWRATQPGS